jgi:hypothetical protein
LKWVGFALLFFVAAFLAYFTEVITGISTDNYLTGYASLPLGVFLILAGYSFYRSAKSLAPLNRLETSGLTTSPGLETGAIHQSPSMMPR